MTSEDLEVVAPPEIRLPDPAPVAMVRQTTQAAPVRTRRREVAEEEFLGQSRGFALDLAGVVAKKQFPRRIVIYSASEFSAVLDRSTGRKLTEPQGDGELAVEIVEFIQNDQDRVCRRCNRLLSWEWFQAETGPRPRLWCVPTVCDCPMTDWLIGGEEALARARDAQLAMIRDPRAVEANAIAMECNLPKVFHAGLHKLERAPGKEAAIDAAATLLELAQAGSRETGLWLHGLPGRGKTAIAKALAYSLRAETGTYRNPKFQAPVIAHGAKATVQYHFVPDLWEMLYSSISEGSHSDLTHSLKNVGFLVLDDLGKEHFTAYKMTELWGILNRRYEAYLPTIVTCRWPIDEWGLKMLERGAEEDDVVSVLQRIHETYQEVEVSGASMRARQVTLGSATRQAGAR